jgi:transcriptional regulator with XRE-family HTH domain
MGNAPKNRGNNPGRAPYFWDVLDSLHNRIREARKKTGLSQRAMAEQLGVGHNCYANFELGNTRLFNRCLYRLVDHLGITPEELLFGERPDESLLLDQVALDNWKQNLIDGYEASLAELRAELEKARTEIADQEKTLDSLRDTNKFLLDELGKRR